MKIGQVFLPPADYLPEGRNKYQIGKEIPLWIPPSKATPGSAYFLYEAPIRKLQIPVFIFAPDGLGSATFNSSILDLSPIYKLEDLRDGAFLIDSLLHQTPPLYWQLLLKIAAIHWRPMLEMNAPFQELLSTWMLAPSVYDKCVDGRKSPGVVTRQNAFIILAWGAWEHEGATWKERVADMDKQGYGQLTVVALEKRVKRLGLPQVHSSDIPK